jgi:hypothetical protein
MPDLITHLSIVYFSNRWLRIVKYSTLLYVGTIIPDILTTAPAIIFPKTEFALYPFHTPLGLFILCLLLSFFFEEKWRKEIFISLIVGCYVHFTIDLLQKHMQPAYTFLFPFSWRSFEIGILWPETIITFVPVWLAVICLIEILSRLKTRHG